MTLQPHINSLLTSSTPLAKEFCKYWNISSRTLERWRKLDSEGKETKLTNQVSLVFFNKHGYKKSEVYR